MHACHVLVRQNLIGMGGEKVCTEPSSLLLMWTDKSIPGLCHLILSHGYIPKALNCDIFFSILLMKWFKFSNCGSLAPAHLYPVLFHVKHIFRMKQRL